MLQNKMRIILSNIKTKLYLHKKLLKLPNIATIASKINNNTCTTHSSSPPKAQSRQVNGVGVRHFDCCASFAGTAA